MPSVEKISIALPAEMVRSLRQAVDSGEYASHSEVVRDALRDWTHKRKLREQGLKGLRSLWRQAIADNAPGAEGMEVLDKLERKYQRLADASANKK